MWKTYRPLQPVVQFKAIQFTGENCPLVAGVVVANGGCLDSWGMDPMGWYMIIGTPPVHWAVRETDWVLYDGYDQWIVESDKSFREKYEEVST